MFNNMKFRSKLVLLLLFPILGLLYFSMSGGIQRIQQIREMNSLQTIADLSVRISSLVHETQKERGATAGFLGSEGMEFGDTLREQRKLTDTRIDELETFLSGFDTHMFGPEFELTLKEAGDSLSGIDTTRSGVDSLTISTNEAISYYSAMNARFLQVAGKLSELSSNGELVNLASAYVNFLLGKERAGIERAVLSNTFAADAFAPGMYQKFSNLVNEQKVYSDVFLSFAPESWREFYAATVSGEAVDEVARMEQIAFARYDKFNLIAELAGYLGYGGLVHQFKNYVLRGNERYVETFLEQYGKAVEVIDRFSGLPAVSDTERDHVQAIKSTIDAYRNHLDRAVTAKNEETPIAAIDQQIQINDGPAVEALNSLLRSGNFNVDPTYWFDTMTKKINLLKEVEDRLSADLKVKADALKSAAQSQFILFMIITVIILILTAAISILVAKGILTQLGGEPATMRELALKVAEGDFHIDMDTDGKEKTGVLLSLMNMVEALKYKADIIETIANKDLTVDIELASENDGLGKSLSTMRNALGEVLSHVREATDQVNTGANQVSQASQALAQGATEQASSLEEISSSITEVNSQSKQNADNATEANGIAKQAATDAESGNSQMKELVEAMNRINASSDEINKVVKVIDDIAFQINLLALNANVEAARAGKYGKGFAVVAEEVRNLAVRAAEAVKETTAMVEDSISNIKGGNQLVDKTAAQLDSIVTGVSKVAEFLGEIASASKEQAQAIDQITEGLDQIDQVTQGNTASAEETASSAEELSSQAQHLQAMIAEFKLEGGSSRRQYIEAPKKHKQQRETGITLKGAGPGSGADV